MTCLGGIYLVKYLDCDRPDCLVVATQSIFLNFHPKTVGGNDPDLRSIFFKWVVQPPTSDPEKVSGLSLIPKHRNTRRGQGDGHSVARAAQQTFGKARVSGEEWDEGVGVRRYYKSRGVWTIYMYVYIHIWYVVFLLSMSI